MNKRIILCALLVATLSLTPGTSRARLYNVNTGRFQTMDIYQGNNEDPLSLHKYPYGSDNPVNRIDPSGHDDFTLPSITLAGGLGASIDAIDLSVTFRAFSWAAFRVVTTAIAIGTVETGDNGGKALFYHYSECPPASFEDGLFPPAWVTPVGGLDAKSAMFKLGINLPSYEYTFRISWYMLGPPDNSTPGRLVQFELLEPTGPGSMVSWRPLF